MTKHIPIELEDIDVSEMTELAIERESAHRHHATSRPLSPDYELIGLLGELAFEKWSGIKMDRQLKPWGDSKVDFVSKCGLTIDVKSARKPFFLLREIGKPHADILVLVGVEPKRLDDGRVRATVTLIGWEWGVSMLRAETKSFTRGIMNHAKNALNLREMSLLEILLEYEPGDIVNFN